MSSSHFAADFFVEKCFVVTFALHGVNSGAIGRKEHPHFDVQMAAYRLSLSDFEKRTLKTSNLFNSCLVAAASAPSDE